MPRPPIDLNSDGELPFDVPVKVPEGRVPKAKPAHKSRTPPRREFVQKGLTLLVALLVAIPLAGIATGIQQTHPVCSETVRAAAVVAPREIAYRAGTFYHSTGLFRECSIHADNWTGHPGHFYAAFELTDMTYIYKGNLKDDVWLILTVPHMLGMFEKDGNHLDFSFTEDGELFLCRTVNMDSEYTCDSE
ncbi:MAG: hypothetical protein AAF787_10740 [Chloroflexota bacterium]